MPSSAQHEEPSRPIARSRSPERAELRIETVAPDDPLLRATLAGWGWTARAIARTATGREARLRLEDGRRIVAELARVLDGEEPGEGTADARAVAVARVGGRIQAVATLFLCPRAVFVELLATAPWNLAGEGAGPPDPRAVRGAGRALVAHARASSLLAGRGGRVALQAENPRCRRFYEGLGFSRMRAGDDPRTLVPPGERGFSDDVRRLAAGLDGPAGASSIWMVLEPERAGANGSVPPRAVARPEAAS